MRHYTTDIVLKHFGQPFEARRPMPFPGDTPTRVAWDVSVTRFVAIKVDKFPHPAHPGQIVSRSRGIYHPEERHRYCGKPSRYRAQELYRLLAQPKLIIKDLRIVEFDKGGIIAWERYDRMQDARILAGVSEVYSAYHPQRPTGFSICGAFSRPVFIKRIGRFPTYSFQTKLSQEKVDAFYAWYEATFGAKLRRPRQKPLTIVGGNFVEEAPEQ